MGCTPSIHVSQTGVVYCRETEDSNSRRPSGYNASTTTATTVQQRTHLTKGDPPSVITTTTSSASVGIRGGVGGGGGGGGGVGGGGGGGGVNPPVGVMKPLKRGTSGASSDVTVTELEAAEETTDSHKKHVVIRSVEAADTLISRHSMKIHDKDCLFGTMRQAQRVMSILLVFDKEDAQSDVLWSAAEKLGYRCTIAKTSENALENYLNYRQDVVIIDGRAGTAGFDADCLCRSMDSTRHSEYSVFVAIRDKVPTDEEEPSISTLLKAGFSRRYHENTSVSSWMNELQSLEMGEVRARVKLQSCAALFAALDSVSDAVEITTSDHEIQYVNQVYERISGYSNDEILGRTITDFSKQEKNRDTIESINRQTKKGKQWEGTFYTRRKSGGSIHFHCKVVPLLLGPGGSVSNYIYVKSQLPDSYNQLANGSMVAFAKRRESVVKAHSVTIEAPITKVINIINAAQENSPLTVAQALDKVLEILQTSELYSPFQTQDIPQDDDPIASELVEGLMTNVKRKLSGHDIHRATHAQGGHSHITGSPAYSLSQMPSNIMTILNEDANWDIDIIELEKLTNNRPLLFLGLKIFIRFEVCDYLNISEACLVNWLQMIESNYHSNNHYHNSTHAADVLQATAYFLERSRTREIFTQQDRVSSLIAAVVHDVDHPARTNAFLINEKHQLALLYNDQAVLENHHASMCFKLTHKDKGVDIFKNLSIDDYKSMRQSIIDQVLATDMKQHFEHLSKFTTSITKHLQKMEGDNTVDSEGAEQENAVFVTDLTSHDNRTLIRRMMIKCADISNPLRPIKICKEWAYRIAEEYCQQTDEEKQRGMPCVMAQFDRKVLDIPKCQLAFINLFISNMFDAWDVYCDVPELMNQLQSNFDYWTSQQELRDKEMSHHPEEDQS